MVKGTATAIKDPFFKVLAEETEKADWIAIAMDQLLGPDTGRVFNAGSDPTTLRQEAFVPDGTQFAKSSSVALRTDH